MILALDANFGLSYLLEIVGLLVVLAFIIRKFPGPWISRLMKQRLESIDHQLKAGDEARADAARLVDERLAALEEARREASSIVDQARESAVRLVEDGKRRAEEDYQRLVTRAAIEIAGLRARARHEVLTDLGSVIVTATELVVRAELDDSSHHRLIVEAISATESEPAEPGVAS